MLITLTEFIARLEEQVANGAIYVWGGCGQMFPALTEAWIRLRERGTGGYKGGPSYADAAVALWKKRCAAGLAHVLRAFDCSGLGTFCLGKAKAKANTMKGWTKRISRAELRRGDWVFRVDGSDHATHIGYVVDTDLNVIEVKGRDSGVVKRPLDASGPDYWNAYGRPKMFALEIEGNAPQKKFVLVTGGSVHVRDMPSKKGNVVRVAVKGLKLPLIAVDPSGWYQVGPAEFISNKDGLTRIVQEDV